MGRKFSLLFPLILLTGVMSGCTRTPPAVSEGVRIEYESAGKGEPALMFIHGWSCSMSYWDAQFSRFAGERRVVRLDLAGHGNSGSNREDWSIKNFSQDVIAVLDALHVDDVILIGHSLGGIVSVEAARHLGSRVSGIICVDTFHDISKTATPAEVETILDAFREDFETSVQNLVRRLYFKDNPQSGIIDRVCSDLTSASPEIAIAVLGNAWKYDVRGVLDDLNPRLICINSADYSTNREAIEKYVTDFTLIEIDSADHYLMLEVPEEFNRRLEEAVAALTEG